MEVTVKFVTPGGGQKEMRFNKVPTAKDVLLEAGFDTDQQFTVAVGGKRASLDTEVSDGQRVIASSKVDGGCP